ncbi:MAG: ribonuclease HI family protein [Candidatus Levybacteria bacterium]|nr:ribonuclease HI family protein [Candidatus Levybacteria bacterium]
MLTHTLTIYGDGGSRGNPGEASYGFVVLEGDTVIYSEGKRIGIATNNVAEYSAVLAALNYLSSSKLEHEVVNFFLDSELVVHQLNGKWKIKNEVLRGYFFKIKELQRDLQKKFTYTAVPREQNKLADEQVNLALDNKI